MEHHGVRRLIVHGAQQKDVVATAARLSTASLSAQKYAVQELLDPGFLQLHGAYAVQLLIQASDRSDAFAGLVVDNGGSLAFARLRSIEGGEKALKRIASKRGGKNAEFLLRRLGSRKRKRALRKTSAYDAQIAPHKDRVFSSLKRDLTAVENAMTRASRVVWEADSNESEDSDDSDALAHLPEDYVLSISATEITRSSARPPQIPTRGLEARKLTLQRWVDMCPNDEVFVKECKKLIDRVDAVEQKRKGFSSSS